MKQTHRTIKPPSRNQVNRVAKIIREMVGTGSEATPWTLEEVERLSRAIETIAAYRAQFGAPLVKVNVGLRQFTATLGIERATVTQRLKREETIRDKFPREPGLQLSSMQDIGGCRVVFSAGGPESDVQELEDLRRLERHIRQSWTVRRDSDYIKEPRSSGYRALHLVVVRDTYPIEIQLRTTRMHNWAQTVESLSGHYSVNYKQDGSSDVQRMMALVSQLDQALELGVPPPTEDLTELRTLAQQVQKSFQRPAD